MTDLKENIASIETHLVAVIIELASLKRKLAESEKSGEPAAKRARTERKLSPEEEEAKFKENMHKEMRDEALVIGKNLIAMRGSILKAIPWLRYAWDQQWHGSKPFPIQEMDASHEPVETSLEEFVDCMDKAFLNTGKWHWFASAIRYGMCSYRDRLVADKYVVELFEKLYKTYAVSDNEFGWLQIQEFLIHFTAGNDPAKCSFNTNEWGPITIRWNFDVFSTWLEQKTMPERLNAFRAWIRLNFVTNDVWRALFAAWKAEEDEQIKRDREWDRVFIDAMKHLESNA